MLNNRVETYVGCMSVAIVCVLVACLLIGGCLVESSNQQWHAGVVLEKYIKRSGGGDAFFVVVRTESGRNEVFSIRDRLWWWQFGSADLYASLNAGQRVKVKTIGYRVQFMSWFPNAVEILPNTEPAR